LLDAEPGTVEGPVVAVLSGGNIDPLLLLRIIRHGMAAGGRYLDLAVRVPDRPGSLARFLADCAQLDTNVVEVAHSRTGRALTVHEVAISVQLETKGREHADAVLAALREKGYTLSGG
jgi:threonine dehydratase